MELISFISHSEKLNATICQDGSTESASLQLGTSLPLTDDCANWPLTASPLACFHVGLVLGFFFFRVGG